MIRNRRTDVDIIEIILNLFNLYEGNLSYYFKVVINHANNLNLPYHNLRHMLHVLWLCYLACKYYEDKLTKREMRILLIAAIWHDFGHIGTSGEDKLNIIQAKIALERHIHFEDVPYKNNVILLLDATEYPHNGDSGNNLSIDILRDADLMQSLCESWIQHSVFGLAAEWRKKPLEVLKEQIKFFQTLKLKTEWARSLYPEEVISNKIIELGKFIEILED